MEVYLGGLVEFKDKDEFEDFLYNISYVDALKLLETSITYATKSGLFDLDENFLLYKCLQKLKKKDEMEKA